MLLTWRRVDRTIAECDENLCGTKLTPAERAAFTQARKLAYEGKYPETRQYAAGGHAKGGSASDKLSFADDTAAKTGVDKRTVERDARRADKIDAEVLASIAGTDLDKGTILDTLAVIPKAGQAAKVAELRQEFATAKTIDKAASEVVVNVFCTASPIGT